MVSVVQQLPTMGISYLHMARLRCSQVHLPVCLPAALPVCLFVPVSCLCMSVCLSKIDMQKMPLGKLSKKQIQSAYAVLTEALREVEGKQDPVRLLDCSNRFFTLIPHDFGMRKPPMLDNPDIIKVCSISICCCISLSAGIHVFL